MGTPIANRNRAEIEGLIGFFVNTLVMRTDTSGNPVFRELLKQVRKSTLDAYAHQDLPFEKLIMELQPERDLSRNPLFQVMFALQNVPVSTPELSGSDAGLIWGSRTTRTRFDLEVHLRETAEGLKCTFVYNTDLFDLPLSRRMAGHYQMMLEGIAANPDQRLSELPLLTEAERHQLLVEWNNTATEYPRDKCIHELFEEQVEKTPDAIAVVFEDQQLTYRELNSKSKPTGTLSEKAGGRDRGLGRHLCGAFIGDGHSNYRHSQGWRGICSFRSGISERATGIHAGGYQFIDDIDAAQFVEGTSRRYRAGALYGSRLGDSGTRETGNPFH